jgi:hypothetical protein
MLYIRKALVRKLEGKRPLERPRCRWKDNIKIILKDLGWIHVAQDRVQWWAVVKAVLNF